MTSKAKNLLGTALAATLYVGIPMIRAADQNAPGRSSRAELPQLQLTVDVPPTWRPFLADDLAEAFASRLSDIFQRSGYSGEVRFIDGDSPRPDAPLLAIRLINWRIGRTENAECTFTATLTNAGKKHDLGIFEHTMFVWNKGMGRWGLADALGDVADNALRNLSTRLAKDNLLTGFSLAGK